MASNRDRQLSGCDLETMPAMLRGDKRATIASSTSR